MVAKLHLGVLKLQQHNESLDFDVEVLLVTFCHKYVSTFKNS